MRRILITWFSKAEGGAESSVIELANFLSEQENFKIVLLFVTSPTTSLKVRKKLSKEVSLYNPQMSLPLYKILSFFVVLSICFKERIDILNTNYRAVVGESLAGKFAGNKVFSTVRAIFIDRSNVRNFIFTDGTIAISKAVAEKMRNLGYKKQVKVIYNGLNLEKFELWPHDEGQSKNYLYFMARLVPWKRPGWFVRAAVKIHEKYPNTRFSIFGRGPQREKLDKLINKEDAEGYIELGGFISRNDPRLKKYGICVHPSFEEPFGKTIIEGIMRNKVMVATKAGGIPEILKDYSLLFKRDSFESLVKKLEEAYSNFKIYHRKISKIKPEVINKFNMRRVGKEYYKFFTNNS